MANDIVYHGTTSGNARSILASGFRQSSDGMLGRGVYLCRDLEDARRFSIGHPEHDKVVIKVEVNLGNVIVIDHQHHPRQKTWHDSRYGPVYDTASVVEWCKVVQRFVSGIPDESMSFKPSLFHCHGVPYCNILIGEL